MRLIRTTLLAASVLCIVAPPIAADASSAPRRAEGDSILHGIAREGRAVSCDPGFSVLDTLATDHVGDAFDIMDVNSDGRRDLVGGSQVGTEVASLSWWENVGDGVFDRHAIDTGLVGANSVKAVDLDQDGHMDFLVATDIGIGQLLWYRNNGSFVFTKELIDTTYHWARSACAADLNGDHHIDIAAAGWPDDPFAWWQNDGAQSFTRHSLPCFLADVWMITAADLDSDGDLDLIAAADSTSEVPWWENDGAGNFTLRTLQGIAYGVTWVQPADLNGDGHMDVVGASEGEGRLIWWENDGNQNFTKHTIPSDWFIAVSVDARDLDADGDVDLVMSRLYSCAWWENDGTGNFLLHPLSGTFQAGTVGATDLNGDCMSDVVLAEWRGKHIVWWKNECPSSPCDCSHHGDIASDGVFDVFDVIGLIDHAFSGAPQPPIDPLCPHLDRGDVNCDRVDDVLDVIYMIDFVFSGGRKPCNLCACSP